MTRCMKNEVNLKSSAYNQTGQNYFEQLAAYNSMSSHLRRILLARSVVDARNKNYILDKNKQCKLTDDKGVYSRPEVTDDLIDRLAYDTEHHPMDILRTSLSPKRSNCCDCNLEHRRSRICSNRACYEGNHRADCRQRSSSRSRRTISPTTCSPKRKKFIPNYTCEQELKREIPRASDQLVYDSRRRKCRYETNSLFIPTTTAALYSTEFKSYFPIRETSDRRSVSSIVSRTAYDDSDCDDKSVGRPASRKSSFQREEEKKYIKFVYDITREIMQSGLYTDKELQDVFKKHIDQNKGILNMNKMLYEIYQLKISLNVTDEDSETDDELEDLIHAQKLLSVSEIRPPTPPKVLDENKVMEKLKSYQKLETQSRPSSGTNKTVILVDANPELLVTERDVLISLMEVGVDPKQAQHVCKSLLQKSRDTVLAETVQVGAEASCSSNLRLDNLVESRDIDKQSFPAAETTESTRRDSTENYSTDDFSEKQTASLSTSNLVDETVVTEEKTDSRRTSEDRQIESSN